MCSFFLIGGKEDDLKSNYIEKSLLSLTCKEKPLMLFFPTASKDNIKSINHFISTFNSLNVEIKVITLFGNYNYEELDNLFSSADIIYFSGGNTNLLVEKLQETRVDLLLKKYLDTNKIYAGISAGAILYTKEGMGDSYSYVDNFKTYNYKMVKGLGFLDFIICPHYNKPDLYIFNDYAKEVDLAYAIENDTAIYINDNFMQIFKANSKNSVYEFKNGLLKPLYPYYNI